MEKYLNKIILGDCLGVMKGMPDKSVDMILCDLPYGTTACKWDVVIPFEPLWEQYKRIIKDNGAIVLFGQEPFSSRLRMSNISMYKYDWVWVKNRTPNFMMAKYCPLKSIENILVFSKGGINQNTKNKMVYTPQGLTFLNKQVHSSVKSAGVNTYNRLNKQYIQEHTGYPKNILEFNCESGIHPTQKPVALCEYLIRTYTKENEVVLDNCIGSGTTAIAAIRTGRQFIGIEKDPEYHRLACERVEREQHNLFNL